MSRAVISEQELVDWINAKLREHEECEECEFSGVQLLRELDDGQLVSLLPPTRSVLEEL